MAPKKRKKLDSGYYHEAADRLHVIQSNLEEHLLHHPAIEHHPEIQIYIEHAQTMLGEAYQKVGVLI